MSKLPVIIDNRDKNTAQAALVRILPNLKKMDVATGIFEIGSFLQLEPQWQTPETIRILMGDETTRTTKSEILKAIIQESNESIEIQKESDDTLTGLAAVRQAIIAKKILMKVFTKTKFHAKCYLMESQDHSPVDFAIVG
ncbi:MAG: hypothetical protein J7L69_13130, partial [Desulfobulbaceae bacterium]|nr:hypothetical protein [Desulfobulbaceae bacterium]